MAEDRSQIPVCPSLTLGVKDLIDQPSEICWYLVKFSLENPGFTSSFIEADLVSFRSLEANHKNDREGLAEAYQDKLSAAIRNYYPNQNYSVDVNPYDIDDLTYGLTITITDGEGVLVLPEMNASIAGDSINVDINNI